MFKQLKTIEKKLDEIQKETNDRLSTIEKVLIVQETNLQQHMKRSEYLEKLVEKVEERDLKPIRKHVNQVEGGFKFLGVVSLVIGIIVGFAKLFSV